MGKKSGKSGKSAKTEVELVVPQASLVTSPLQGSDPAELPFREWSDQEVNAEKWTADTGKGKAKPPAGAEGAAKLFFEDPQVVHLPISIVAHEWKRPSEVYPEVQFTIFEEKPIYPDLISGSKHLLHSEFVRSFISSVSTLMYLGNTRQFTAVEFVTPTYLPNTGDYPWRPWHHIYSNCKLGKGKEHAPVVNAIGKYIVRLFWMGAWRKIYVDDLLPIDMINHVLLPNLELTKEEQERLFPPEEAPPPTPATVDTGKKSKASEKKKAPPVKVIEIWPFLLSKALMKIASLTWYDSRELLDFDIIQCLTGWVPQKINTKDLSINDIWEICAAYTDHFCWPSDKSEASTKGTKGSKDSKKSKGSKKGGLEDLDPGANAHHLLARCNDLRSFEEDEVLDISPCWSHYFLIDQSRDIPLIKPTLTADLAFWKTFRWLDWAVEKGLISPEENMDQIRCFKLVSPFKKIYEHVVYKQPSKMAIEIEEAVKIVAELDKGKKGKGKGKEAKADKSSKASSKSDKGSKGSKGSKGGKGGKAKKLDLSLIPNPSIWVDYEKLSYQINSITIYLKPSKFKTRTKITDMAAGVTGKAQAPKKKGDATPEWKLIIHPRSLRECRNEPVYVFSDSVDYKLLVINLLQTGYTPIFDKKQEQETLNPTEGITECEFCAAALVKRVKRNITKSEQKRFITLTPDEAKPIEHERPRAHLVLEKFDWQREAIGEMVTSITTFGGKTTVLDLCPGRHVFRLWIKSDTPYVAYIFSDTAVVTGPMEEILFSLSQESQLLISTCIEIASCFGKLVQSFGMPEFEFQLKAFYNSYKPMCMLSKAESNTVHDIFYNLLYGMVEQNMTPLQVRALKILLLKWQLPRYVANQVEPFYFCNCYEEEEEFDFMKIMERCVVKIQYFFLGIYERSLMRHHRPEHKNYFKTFEYLKSIYTQFFSSDKRLKIFPTFLRNFLDHPQMTGIKHKYRLRRDLENVVTLQEIIGAVSLPENDWAFICRQQFFIVSPEPVLVKIDLFCDVVRYMVRVIDNDTKKELKKYTNNVTVSYYESNVNGYTALCYGWSTIERTSTYKLSFAIKKEINENRLLVPAMATQVEMITGSYIPNVNNYICRYLVLVSSDKVLLSTRFWCCYQDALVTLRLLDDYGVVLQEVTGKKNVVLPAVMLEYREKETPQIPSDMSLKLKKLSLTSSSKSFTKRSDKGSSKSLTRSRKSSQSKRSSGDIRRSSSDFDNTSEIEEVCLDTIYLIEVIVVDDTWPLKVEEWRGVSALKTEMLYGPILKEASSSQSRTVSKRSSDSMKKRSSSSRSASETTQETLIIETPYWVLQTICNSSDPVQFARDTRREDEIRNIKIKWYELDPMRYDVSQDLRQQYLEENRIPNEDLPDLYSGIRSLDPNYFASEILPPYDLSEFMGRIEPKVGYPPWKDEIDEEKIEESGSLSDNGSLDNIYKDSSIGATAGYTSSQSLDGEIVYGDMRHTSFADEDIDEESGILDEATNVVIADEDKRKLKTELDFENDIQNELCQLEEFEATHEQMTEGMDNFIVEQMDNFDVLSEWFNGCREDSVIMMDYGLSLKADYIKFVLEELEKNKPKVEKGKKDKKDKKGKKK